MIRVRANAADLGNARHVHALPCHGGNLSAAPDAKERAEQMRFFGKWPGFGQMGKRAHFGAVFWLQPFALCRHVGQVGSGPDHLHKYGLLCDGKACGNMSRSRLSDNPGFAVRLHQFHEVREVVWIFGGGERTIIRR